MGNYIPSTQAQQREMLDRIGAASVDELFSQIPQNVKVGTLNLPDGLSELEVHKTMSAIAQKNTVFPKIFRGAGAYNHYIPSIVKTITSKEEFLTTYTPYQAEISQGVLQSIFEYQTMMCELTGMDASNASIYDGATAAAEAAAMCKDRKRTKVLVSAAAHPHTIATVQTYCDGADCEMILVPMKNGKTDLELLSSLLNEESACFYMQQPNYFGQIEDAASLGEIVHAAGAKYIMGCYPTALALLKTPRECGADIAVGEGQPLGQPLAFGGPYLGYMTCTAAMTRKLPGRIVGQTTDVDGKRAFVLTLQAREQHIRREKASSNVCSNQALCALTAAVYLSVLGAQGLYDLAVQCMSKAKYAAEQIASIPGFEIKYDGPFFNEFYTACPVNSNHLMKQLESKGILGGLPVDGGILWCVTELNTKADIDELVNTIREVCGA